MEFMILALIIALGLGVSYDLRKTNGKIEDLRLEVQQVHEELARLGRQIDQLDFGPDAELEEELDEGAAEAGLPPLPPKA